MLEFFKTKQSHGDYGASAMESETISKNEANLKNKRK